MKRALVRVAAPGRRLDGMAMWLLAAVLAWFSPLASAFNVYTVGGDADCAFTSIQDAVDAAAANPGTDYVWIANTGTYADQSVTVGNQDVIIEGGFASCASVDFDSTDAVIAGNGSQSVFDISNGEVDLNHLEITGGGGNVSESGGGIYFHGSGDLTLADAWVHGNQSGGGGGIAFISSAGGELSLQGVTLSLNHAAGNGGAVWVGGNYATLYSDSATYITTNSAAGDGGGIHLDDRTTAYINSNINDNSSGSNGGGIYSNGGVSLNLYSTDPNAHVTLYGNSAAQNGGGIYVYAPSATANLCAQDFFFQANTAQNGAALMTNGADANVSFNDAANPCVPSNPPVPPVACAPGPGCNEIVDNVEQASDGTPTGGGTIMFGTGGNTGTLFANRFAARRNHGAAVISIDDSVPPVAGSRLSSLYNCLIADNVESTASIYAIGNAADTALFISNCTITHETQPTSSVAIVGDVSFIEIDNSIIYNPGLYTLYFTSEVGTLSASYDLLNSSAGMPGTDIIQGVPSFVDAASGDYHLLSSSLGVDEAPDNVAFNVDTDLDGHPRVVDLPDVPNDYGPLDLGAYEIPSDACSASDAIFCDGFDR